MNDNITKDDLREFRMILLNDITEILQVKQDIKHTTESTEWLRSRAIRKIMDISPATLQNLRVTGKIRFKKVMGSYYYKRVDILNLFKE